MQSASTLKSAKKQTSIGAELVKRVLKERALDYAFQPIVRSKDRSVFALEALCRPPAWLHLGPSDLFDTALRTGLIWQLGQAGRDRIAQLIPLLDKGALLFLNLHPAEIEDPALLSREHPLAAYSERIVFEITERASIPDFDHLKRKLTALRHRGYRFAVDDLGAGYASLCALALLEPDFIKLDRTLIHGASSSRRRVSLLSRIIDFAAEHQIQVIAEGIEEEVDAKCVVEVGCPLLQGYLFGRPERATR
jgi:EAL domain-containing protein (putative c-di-GMP-specific phosphodiesterase class I)